MTDPEPTSLKTKIFGDNRINFYAWIVVGFFLMGGSGWFLFLAIRAGVSRSPVGLVLIAIYFVLLGHFGIALQNYCAHVARVLDAARHGPGNLPET